MSLLGEIKRRKVFQVAAVYVVVAWLLVQVITSVEEPLNLPEWADSLVIVLLAAGFPIALILSWAYERTPAGVIRDRGPGSESTPEIESALPNQGFGLAAYAAIAGSLVAALIVGIVIGRVTLQPSEPAEIARTPIPLTANPQDNAVVSAAISPDGRYLAYADNAGLSLRLVETGETHPLALPDGFQLREIDWFPDGTQLLISATVSDITSLWKLAIVGGEPRMLRERASRAAISPDGNRIAYLPTTFPTSEIYVMGSEGEDATRLVDVGDSALWELAWSSNSRWLAYGSSVSLPDGVETSIEIVDVSDGTRNLIIKGNRLWQNWRGSLPFHWTPDNRLIYARRDLPPNQARSNLWQVDIDPDTGEISGTLSQITRVTSANFRDLSMTADGSRLVFLLENNQADVYVGELLGDNRVLRNSRRLTFDERNDYPDGWTADSRELFFSSDRGVSQAVFRQNIQESVATALTSYSVSAQRIGDLIDSRGQRGAELSPDGEWILFWEQRDPDDVLVRVPSRGGPSETVLGMPGRGRFRCPLSIDVSPDCVLSTKGEDNQIVFYAFNPVYGLGRELVTVEGRSFFYQWDLSPDGERIALVNNDGRLRIISIEDGAEREIVRDGWNLGEFVSWLRDGSGVIVDGTREEAQILRKGLLYVSLETEEVRLLRQEPNQWHVRPRISPDGHWVAFGLMVYSGNAWMIESP
ncbi:MAG: hypothetical protein O7D29_11615 [Gemmatimonadetes bacterium]|nr:hypothetical protein [Gemmatimonadota bacterium]